MNQAPDISRKQSFIWTIVIIYCVVFRWLRWNSYKPQAPKEMLFCWKYPNLHNIHKLTIYQISYCNRRNHSGSEINRQIIVLTSWKLPKFYRCFSSAFIGFSRAFFVTAKFLHISPSVTQFTTSLVIQKFQNASSFSFNLFSFNNPLFRKLWAAFQDTPWNVKKTHHLDNRWKPFN